MKENIMYFPSKYDLTFTPLLAYLPFGEFWSSSSLTFVPALSHLSPLTFSESLFFISLSSLSFPSPPKDEDKCTQVSKHLSCPPWSKQPSYEADLHMHASKILATRSKEVRKSKQFPSKKKCVHYHLITMKNLKHCFFPIKLQRALQIHCKYD